jgi:prepilin-type N-terminal cleavage/methylation domain-containing protein
MKYFSGREIKVNPLRGFTLIELLVVIAIIGLLASVVMASLNGVRMKGRNAARLASIDTLYKAFNVSAGDSGVFPSTGGNWACVTTTCYEGWAPYGANATVDAFLAPSLPQKPSDPIGGSRGYGGFLYINPYTVSGITGAWLNYLAEPSGSCGAGLDLGVNANYRQCLRKVD